MRAYLGSWVGSLSLEARYLPVGPTVEGPPPTMYFIAFRVRETSSDTPGAHQRPTATRELGAGTAGAGRT